MSKPNEFVARILVLLLLTSTMIMGSAAEERSYKRPDPLRGFKTYNGSYNVTNKHYLASAAFTGVHSYAIAAIWLLCGLVFGVTMMCKNPVNNSNSSSKGFLDHHYFIMFLLIVVLTFLVIVATSLVLATNESTLHRIRKFSREIKRIGRTTHRTIHKLVMALTGIQHIITPYDPGMSVRLYAFTHLLANESQIIQDFVKQSTNAIDTTIQASHILHIVVVSINLVFLLASLVLLLLHWHPGLITIIVFCWILTTLCWALAGFDFFLHTLSEDTCTELKNFDLNPQNSTLSSMIRCIDPSYSESLLAEVGKTIYSFISLLNSKVSELSTTLASEEQNVRALGSGKICEPFSGAPNYTYVPESCSNDSIQVGNLPGILSNLTCYEGNSTETCRSQGKVIPESYSNIVSSYSRSIQDMLDIFPDLQNLTKCIIVKATFSDIVHNQCRPLQGSIRLLCSSLLCLSIFMVVLILIWVVRTYQEMGRHFTRWSIAPISR